MSLLDPFSHALATVLAATHDGLTTLGLPGDSALTWLLCIGAVVVLVRTALLPFTVHGVRQAHAASRARPHLTEITERYRGRTDADSVKKMLEERRGVSAEHGVSRLGYLPVLVQLPVWITLYQLISDVARGSAVGAMGPALVASLGGASLLGVSLAGTGYLGGGPAHLAVVLGLALTAAALSYATQKLFVAPNTVLDAMPEAMVTAHRLMPTLSAIGLVVAGGIVPVALLGYWVLSSTWTLTQSAVVMRWFPTPGTEAARRFA